MNSSRLMTSMPHVQSKIQKNITRSLHNTTFHTSDRDNLTKNTRNTLDIYLVVYHPLTR